MRSSPHSGFMCILLIGLLPLIGCDSMYRVKYEVRNESGDSIQVISSIWGVSVPDTSEVADGIHFAFAEEKGMGYTTEEYLDQLRTLPAYLIIRNHDGVPYNKDPNDLGLWWAVYPDDPEGLGRVYLSIKPQDFDQ